MGKSTRCGPSLWSRISSLHLYRDRHPPPPQEGQGQAPEEVLTNQSLSLAIRQFISGLASFSKNNSLFGSSRYMLQLEELHDIKIVYGIGPVAGSVEGH
jgi:hypothetical protein